MDMNDLRARLLKTRGNTRQSPVSNVIEIEDKAALLEVLGKSAEANIDRNPGAARGFVHLYDQVNEGFATTYGALDKAISGLNSTTARVRLATSFLKGVEKTKLEPVCALVLSQDGRYGRGVDGDDRDRYEGLLKQWGLKKRISEKSLEREAAKGSSGIEIPEFDL